MKKIIEDTVEAVYPDGGAENTNQLLKLRLRGKGSGYKEGPEQMESEDELHLCVSAKDDKVYRVACQSVEMLLQAVYSEYAEYTANALGEEVNL